MDGGPSAKAGIKLSVGGSTSTYHFVNGTKTGHIGGEQFQAIIESSDAFLAVKDYAHSEMTDYSRFIMRGENNTYNTASTPYVSDPTQMSPGNSYDNSGIDTYKHMGLNWYRPFDNDHTGNANSPTFQMYESSNLILRGHWFYPHDEVVFNSTTYASQVHTGPIVEPTTTYTEPYYTDINDLADAWSSAIGTTLYMFFTSRQIGNDDPTDIRVFSYALNLSHNPNRYDIGMEDNVLHIKRTDTSTSIEIHYKNPNTGGFSVGLSEMRVIQEVYFDFNNHTVRAYGSDMELRMVSWSTDTPIHFDNYESDISVEVPIEITFADIRNNPTDLAAFEAALPANTAFISMAPNSHIYASSTTITVEDARLIYTNSGNYGPTTYHPNAGINAESKRSSVLEITDNSELRLWDGISIYGRFDPDTGKPTIDFINKYGCDADPDTYVEKVSFTFDELRALKEILAQPRLAQVTEEEYEALDPPDPHTVYVVGDDE